MLAENAVSVNTSDSPVDVLRVQLQEFRELALTGNEAGRDIYAHHSKTYLCLVKE